MVARSGDEGGTWSEPTPVHEDRSPTEHGFVSMLPMPDGQAALVSMHRLDAEVYGLPANPDLLFQRLVKEAIHELGHTYSLLHCTLDRCVMASSTYVEGIDMKSERFCDDCLRVLRRKVPGLPRQAGARA